MKAKKSEDATYVTDVKRLVNGVKDNEKYRIGYAEFEKEMVRPFKGASDLRCAVRFVGAIVGHELILSGVQPGTNILVSTLAKDVFSSKVKSVELHRALAALYTYIHRHLAKTSKGEAAVANPKPAANCMETVPAIPSDLRLIWNGKDGLVENNGMHFLVSEERKGKYKFPVVRVHLAPQGTELFDLSGSPTYITVAKLHGSKFFSPLPEGSRGWETQKRIWEFLRGQFAKAGITGGEAKAKPVSVAQPGKPERTKPEDAYKGSTDIGQLVSGFDGDYVLGEPGARAVIRVRNYENGANKKKYAVAEFVRCEAKNPLRRTKSCTYIPHSWLRKHLSEIEIKGARAVDMTELHLYLTTIIEAHSDEVYASMGASVKVAVLGNPLQAKLSTEPPREGEPLH